MADHSEDAAERLLTVVLGRAGVAAVLVAAALGAVLAAASALGLVHFFLRAIRQLSHAEFSHNDRSRAFTRGVSGTLSLR